MKHALLGACALSTLLATTAFAAPVDQPGHKSPAPGTNSETMSAVEDSTASLVGKVSAEMTTTTKGFVTAAATSDMYEVEAGRIAQQRGQTAAVKDFGAMMVKAHTETTGKLKAIIADGNIAVTPPAHLDDRRQGMIDNLRGATLSGFRSPLSGAADRGPQGGRNPDEGLCRERRQCGGESFRARDLARGAGPSAHGAEAGSLAQIGVQRSGAFT